MTLEPIFCDGCGGRMIARGRGSEEFDRKNGKLITIKPNLKCENDHPFSGRTHAEVWSGVYLSASCRAAWD